MNFLQKIDQFGVPLQLHTQKGITSYKSKIGGIITIMIYTLCLMYAILVIYNWRTGSIPPKVITTLKKTGDQAFLVPEGDIQLKFANLKQNIFSSKRNIITPLVIFDTDDEVDQYVSTIFSESNTIILKSFKLIQSSVADGLSKTSRLFLFLIRCDQNRLTEGQYCAPDSEIDSFLSTYGEVMTLQITLHQFNQQLDQNESIKKKSYITLEKDFNLYTQINLQTTKQMQDKNIFIENYQESSYISNFAINSQVASKSFIQKTFGFDTLSLFLFSLDSLQTETRIIYPKIGEILASIGSIVSIVLSLKIIAESLNSINLLEEFINFIISLKYPKFRDTSIKKDILGKIIKVKYKDKELNVQRFILKYNQVRADAISYLQLNRIIEIILNLQKKCGIDDGLELQDMPVKVVSQLNRIQPLQFDDLHRQQYNQQSESIIEIDHEFIVSDIFK